MDSKYSEAEIDSVAATVLSLIKQDPDKATVVTLKGELGAGKTTLVQKLAQNLGVVERVVSPTFTIAKFYNTTDPCFQRLIHIDAYRIESVDELIPLRFDDLLHEPSTIIFIEWPERIARAIPHHAHHFAISHEGENRRITTI